jgi:hypothetical protein
MMNLNGILAKYEMNLEGGGNTAYGYDTTQSGMISKRFEGI